MGNNNEANMDVAQPIAIESLSDYIKLLQEYPSDSCIFRGEHAEFDKRQASAFRSRVNFMQCINEYYTTVGYRLTDIEKQNFLAFAQHHWLPTNLLDVTSNPLSALFFACHNANEKGFVYIFSNWFQIDITEIVEEFPRQSVFDLFIEGNLSVVNKIHSLTKELFESKRSLIQFTGTSFIMPGNQFINHLFCSAYCVAKDMFSHKNEAVIDNITYEELQTNVCGDGIVRSNELFFQGFYKAVNVERERFNKLLDAICEDDVMSDVNIPKGSMDDLMYYIIFLLYCFRVKRKFGSSISLINHTELFPVMIYRPKITFERARLQQGYFIYVPYIAASGVYSDIEVEMNNLNHVQVIEIQKPAQVLLELENIGINIGTIYGDFDNVAKYIKGKAAKQTIGGPESG